MKIIQLSSDQVNRATRLAEETLALFAEKQGHYTNDLNSHLRGKLGEIAASQVLQEQGYEVKDLWADVKALSQADIVSRAFKADVKTWNRRFWPEFGRCVAVAQLPLLAKKADLVIWCYCAEVVEPSMKVKVVGWNSIEDIENAPKRLTGPTGGRLVQNFQLDDESIRSLDSLPRSTGQLF